MQHGEPTGIGMAAIVFPQQNHILDALPAAERERIYPHLKLVTLPLGAVLYESGDTLRHIYFPTDSIVSLLYVLEDGSSAEICACVSPFSKIAKYLPARVSTRTNAPSFACSSESKLSSLAVGTSSR